MGTPILIPISGSRFGFSSSIGTASFVTLTNATVSTPSGEQMNVVSTSASDSSAGTGIRQVRIVYFDTNWQLSEEIIIMNGITNVSTVATDIIRVETFEAYQTGSNSFAVGTVTLKSLDGLKTYAQIDIGYNTFTIARHYVSPGRIEYLKDIALTCFSTGGVIFQILISKDNTSGGGGIVFLPDMIYVLPAGSIQMKLDIPIVCDATHASQALTMSIAVKGLAASQVATASFRFIEI